jgi:8-oxo-dGTP pyrophosphatase MutT (NUDIX family)
LGDRRRVPRSLADVAAEYLESGREPVEPRPASTVVLLRDGEHGIAVYLLRRHSRMAFAAGMYAFPGGAVDPRDYDAEIAWSGPAVAEWAERMQCPEPEARALVCAALRETFEESGVLLAGEGTGMLIADTRGEDWEADRAALVARSLSFSALVARRGLVLRTDLLSYWAHWVTPEFEPRRYDTRFFVARMPAGQRTRDVSGEADRAHWMSAAEAARGAADGTMEMLPPTSVTLAEIAAYGTVSDLLDASSDRAITTVRPGVEIVDGEPVFTDVAEKRP